jgi:TRAP-type transport system periplasmic protein
MKLEHGLLSNWSVSVDLPKEKFMLRFVISTLIAVLFVADYNKSQAQEISLRAVTALAEGTWGSKNFERFIEKVNADGKGLIQITYIGGPRAMPPFEVGNAVRGGVVDIANVPGAYYTNLLPEADALKLVTKPMTEVRRNGGWELLNQLHNQKLNSEYLARWGKGVSFHFYLNKFADKFDLTGRRIRTTPIYRDLVEQLGGIPVTIAQGEVYTALERGVVDGYGWPLIGIFDLGWERVTKMRVEPGFYNVDLNVLVNLDRWKRLSPAQQKILQDAALWLEGLDQEHINMSEDERQKQSKAGIRVFEADDEQAKRFASRAADIGWSAITSRSPAIASKMRNLLAD